MPGCDTRDEKSEAASSFSLHPGNGVAIVGGSAVLTRPLPMSEIPSSQQAADRRLLAETAGGKTEAFAALYDRLSGPLFTLCVRMIGDAGEAEDVLQEAFLTIWRRAATYDPERASVFTWAVHLTRCKIIDHLRARGRRLRVLAAPSEDPADLAGPSRFAGRAGCRRERGGKRGPS